MNQSYKMRIFIALLLLCSTCINSSSTEIIFDEQDARFIRLYSCEQGYYNETMCTNYINDIENHYIEMYSMMKFMDKYFKDKKEQEVKKYYNSLPWYQQILYSL